MVSAGRFILSVLCPAVLVLAACASDATFTIAGRSPNPKALEEDASDCRSIGPVLTGFFSGALVGAAQGAQIGVASGTVDAGAVAGAAVGSLAGLVVGSVVAVSGGGYESCMAKKGYQRVEAVDGEQAGAPADLVIDEPAR